MKIGETIYQNWYSEGGGQITRTEEGYELYEVPQYGGEPMFVGHYETLEEAKAVAETWT